MSTILFLFLLSPLSHAAEAAPREPAPFTKKEVQISEFQVSYFQEVYDYIEKLKTDASLVPVDFHSKACQANQDLQKLIASCALSDEQKKPLESTAPACLEAAEPISRFLQVNPKRPGLSDTRSIKRQLEIVGTNMVRTAFPKAFISDENKALADSILRKVFFEEIGDALTKRSDALAPLASGTVSCGGEKGKEQAESAYGEIKELIEDLGERNAEGAAAAQQELSQIAEKGRQLGVLPFPSLTLNEREKLTMFLSAFMWRARGGGFFAKDKDRLFKTQGGRIRYVYNAYQALVELNGWKSRMGAVGRSMGLRATRGWRDGHDMGTMNGTRDGDFKALQGRGPWQTVQLEKLLRKDGYDDAPMKFGGEQMASCYVFSWDIMTPKNAKGKYEHRLVWGADLQPPLNMVTKGPLTWGEVCWGAAMGLGISKSLLHGH